MPLSTRLTDEEAVQIFEAVLQNKPLPTRLPLNVIRVNEHGLPIKPPSHPYEFGLYLLMAPAKRNKQTNTVDYPKVPSSIEHLVVQLDIIPVIHWQVGGPQFPLPTAIQQRYLYPTGPSEYCYGKGSSLWTLYESPGKEYLDLRLLHVYYSPPRRKYTSRKKSVKKKSKVTKKSINPSKPRGRNRTCALAKNANVTSPFAHSYRNAVPAYRTTIKDSVQNPSPLPESYKFSGQSQFTSMSNAKATISPIRSSRAAFARSSQSTMVPYPPIAAAPAANADLSNQARLTQLPRSPPTHQPQFSQPNQFHALMDDTKPAAKPTSNNNEDTARSSNGNNYIYGNNAFDVDQIDDNLKDLKLNGN